LVFREANGRIPWDRYIGDDPERVAEYEQAELRSTSPA